MKYVKLTAKNDTWFKEGTEVLWETNEKDSSGEYIDRRPTLDEYNSTIKNSCWNVFRGIRVNQEEYEFKLFGMVGLERIDGEVCSDEEFEIEIVDEQRFG